ncbi:MAG TPA: MarR family transcriptional regulator [Solirubrobacteraceae bacterium]
MVVTPKQLASELGELWGSLMRARGESNVIALFEELDLSLTHVKTLSALSNCAEDASVKGLADLLGLSLPATSRTVDVLLRRGWLARREDEQDRRIKRVRLTDEGRDVIERIHTARMEGIEAWTAELSDGQRKRLSAALRPILDSLETPR